jgi:predicted acetyltransferase
VGPEAVEVRGVTPPELAAFHECAAIAFHEPLEEGDVERFARTAELDRMWAAFDEDRVVATGTAYSVRLSVPGAVLDCAAVSWLTVLPTHRRRGLLRLLLGQVLDDARRRGEPLAALWASSGGLYGRFGFGAASFGDDVRIALGAALPRHASQDDLRLTLEPVGAGAVATVAPVYDRCARHQTGALSRSAAWWESRLLTQASDRLVIARRDGGRPAGYALYRTVGPPPTTCLRLTELVAEDTAVSCALWRYLCARELAEEIVAPNRPTDEALRYCFEDLRRVRVDAHRDSLWLRLLDAPGALVARSWAADADVVLELRDDQVPDNGGTWRLEARAQAPSRCTRTDATADIVLDTAELAAVYLGGVALATLRDAGRVVEHTSGAVDALDDALRVRRAPWTVAHF